MDPRVHHLQGEAERVKTSDLTALLGEFYREKAALVSRHIAGAALVSSYEFNNAYQYIINRDETHLDWLRSALADQGVTVPADVPARPTPAGRRGAELEKAVIEDDARLVREFVTTWTPRVAGMSHARHRKMLQIVLGESQEQQRFFDDMLRGRDDVLGRRHANTGTGGGVLAQRWRE